MELDKTQLIVIVIVALISVIAVSLFDNGY